MGVFFVFVIIFPLKNNEYFIMIFLKINDLCELKNDYANFFYCKHKVFFKKYEKLYVLLIFFCTFAD